MRSPMSNLSQSVESMLSVQSAPVAANLKTTAEPLTGCESAADGQAPSSGDSGRTRLAAAALETMPETSTENDEQVENNSESLAPLEGDGNGPGDDAGDTDVEEQLGTVKLTENFHEELKDENVESVVTVTETVKCEQDGSEKADVAENACRHPIAEGRPRVSNNLSSADVCGFRWRSKDLESGLSSCPPGVVQQRVDSGLLENRRCTSECSLNQFGSEMDVRAKNLHPRRIKEVAAIEKTLADGASVASNGSDDKNVGAGSVRNFLLVFFTSIVFICSFGSSIDVDIQSSWVRYIQEP